jgi:hypothetical protein
MLRAPEGAAGYTEAAAPFCCGSEGNSRLCQANSIADFSV